MLASVKEFWGYLWGLGLDTLRVFWRLFPKLYNLQLIGWIGFTVAQNVAAAIASQYSWLALGVFSFSLLFVLTPIILQLRLIGEHLSVRELLPEDHPEDDRDEGITRLLALTLLPFLGMYSAFGYVEEHARKMLILSLVQSPAFEADRNVMARLMPDTASEMWMVGGIIGSAYVVRRLLDLLHDATEIRVLGLLAATCESFFILSLLTAGGYVISEFQMWWSNRAIVAWWDVVMAGLTDAFAVVKINLPGVLVVVGSFLSKVVWPLLTGVLAKPIIWLAVAALVYGSHLLSVAEVWQKGEKPSDALRQLTRSERRAAARTGVGGYRRGWLEFQEIFLGDIDDKYVPSFQSLRLVLHVGVLYLAAFVTLHTAVSWLGTGVTEGIVGLTGGQTNRFWTMFHPFFNLVEQLVEPLRITLLAVAFRQVMLMLRQKADQGPDQIKLTDAEGVVRA